MSMEEDKAAASVPQVDNVTPPVEVNGDQEDEAANSSKRTLSLQDEQLLTASLQQKKEPIKNEKDEVLEGIFEPRPSTSSSPAARTTAKRSMSLAVDCSSERRQRLALLPRTSQYEKHALLQERSGDAGLSELEIFLLEKEQSVPEEHQKAATASALVPRGAHYETNALLTKKNSGLTELEQYLQEKEAELLEKNRRHSDPQRKQRLEPRCNQYEANPLLQSKDEAGLSPIEHLLISKVEEAAAAAAEDDKGKCSARCACKNARCANCKSDSSNSNSSAGSPKEPVPCTLAPRQAASIKHVHFDGNGQKDNVQTQQQQEDQQQQQQQQPKCKEGDAKFWKLGSGRKKSKEGAKEEDSSAKANDLKKKSNVSSHKRSCAIS